MRYRGEGGRVTESGTEKIEPEGDGEGTGVID